MGIGKQAADILGSASAFIYGDNYNTYRNKRSLCFLGRFDQYMFPFYSADIKSGAVTRESIQELIEILYMKDIWWTKLRDRMTVIANSGRGMGGDLEIGGVDKEGKDATNDLTYMCLDALAHTRWGTPWLAVRWHENTPRELKVKTANVIRIGTGQPKIFNDQAAIPAAHPFGQKSGRFQKLSCGRLR